MRAAGGGAMPTTYRIAPQYSSVTLGSDSAGSTVSQSATTTATVFTITRSGDLPAEVDGWNLLFSPGLTINYFKSPASGSVSFVAGQTSATIQVDLNNTIVPPLELNAKGFGYTFGLNLNVGTTAAPFISDTQSGGYGITIHDYRIVVGGGNLTLSYDMYTIPDKAEIYINGALAATTSGFVPGQGTLTVGNSILTAGADVQVVITGDDPSTAWDYRIDYVPGISTNAAGYEQVNFPAPTLLDLANMASDVYNRVPSAVGNYRVLPAFAHPSDFHGLQVEVYANPDDSQIVVAVRGSIPPVLKSLQQTPWEFLKNWFVSDPSFATGTPSGALRDMVATTAAIVKSVRASYPDANITLTGHSLGGGIAQLIGAASHIQTYAFDAPGGSSLSSKLTNELAPVSNIGSSYINDNIRLEGDPVSRIGNAIGSTYTVVQPGPFSWAKDAAYHALSPTSNPSDPSLIGYLNTFTDTSLTSFTSSSKIYSGIPSADTDYTSTYATMIVGAVGLTAYFAPVLVLGFAVGVGVLKLVDPTSGSSSTFTRNATSPAFSSITLPSSPGVVSYLVSTSTGGSFTAPVTVAPGTSYSIGSSVTSIRFAAVDGSNNPVLLPSAFPAGLTFSSSGQVQLTVTSFTQSYAGDLDGNGKGDLVWQNDQGQASTWIYNAPTVVGSTVGGANGSDWRLAGIGDLNSDGRGDLIWQNDQGQAVVWLMDGSTILDTALIGAANGANWRIRAIGDINGDHRSDIVWENEQGQAVVWFMNGATVSGGVTVGAPNGGNWTIRGVGDVNGDGKSDIVWQNSQGQAAVWLMNAQTVNFATFVGGPSGRDWQIKGVGDVDGDGNADIVWQNNQGQASLWLMSGATLKSASLIGGRNGSNLQIKEVADLNGDGKADLVWQTDQGQAAQWIMNGAAISSASLLGGANGSSWMLAGGNANVTRYDFDGDGKADLLWQNNQGQASLWRASGSSLVSADLVGGVNGASMSIKTVADFNGDGLSDVVWQTTSGQAIVWLMSGRNIVSAAGVGGANGAGMQIVGAGDLNGDGMSDILWETDQGQAIGWIMNGTNIVSAAGIGPALGGNWRIKGVGDLNGDGQSDIVWQNGQGQAVAWFMNGTSLLSAAGVGGANGANWQIKGVADLNGDSRSDIVWQNDQGQAAVWLMNGSTISSAALVGSANGSGVSIGEVADLNGDGFSDLVWQTSQGQAAAWLMNGTTLVSAAAMGGANGSDWRLA